MLAKDIFLAISQKIKKNYRNKIKNIFSIATP